MLHKWKEQFMEQNEGVKHMSDSLSEVLKERTGETVEFNAHLKEVIDFLNFYRTTVQDTFEKWNSSRQ